MFPSGEAPLVRLASACREGLESLSRRAGSMFEGFPVATCGPASELVGRALNERLGVEGVYVCAVGHPALAEGQTHAWSEVDDCTIDITHDQFAGVALGAWVLPAAHEWYAQFADCDRRAGYCGPAGWPCYPHDGYGAIEAALDRLGITLQGQYWV